MSSSQLIACSSRNAHEARPSSARGFAVEAQLAPPKRQAGGDLDRAGSAQHVEQNQFALARGHPGIDAVEAGERAAGDGDREEQARGRASAATDDGSTGG